MSEENKVSDLAAVPAPAFTIKDVVDNPYTPMTDADQDAIVRTEVARMQAADAGEKNDDKPVVDTSDLEKPDAPADPNPKDDDTKKRGPDGKFLKAGDKPAEIEKPAEPAQEKPAPLPEPPAAFDVDAIVAAAIEEVGKKKYNDAPGADGKVTEVDGSQLISDYGQIIEPVRDMLKGVAKKIADQFEAKLAGIRETIEAPARATAADAMIAAVAELVPDFRELNVDPRFAEFIEKNPQYGGLVSLDPKRASDVAFLVDRFRDAYQIAKPAAKTTKPAATVTPVTRPRSVQAALSSARGGGEPVENSELTATEAATKDQQTQEEFVRQQTMKLQREEEAQRRRTGI